MQCNLSIIGCYSILQGNQKKMKSACELGKEAYDCRILKDGLKRILDGIFSFSSAKKEVVCDSLMKVVWAIRETITLEMVKKG